MVVDGVAQGPFVWLALASLAAVSLGGCTRRGGADQDAVEAGRAAGGSGRLPTSGKSAPAEPQVVPARLMGAYPAWTLDATHLRASIVETSAVRHAFRFHALGGTSLVSHGLRVAVLGEETSLTWSDIPWPEAPEPDPFYGGGEVDVMGGAWPAHAYATLSDVRPRVAALRRQVRWDQTRWVDWDTHPTAGGVFVSMVPWAVGGALVLQHVDAWSAGAEAPRPQIVVVGNPSTAALEVPDGMRPVALWSAKNGDVYAVAARARDEAASAFPQYDGPGYVLRWTVGGGFDGRAYALPPKDGRVPQARDVRLLLEIDGAVHVAGGAGDDAADMWTPYLAREGDERWSLEPLPASMKGMLARVAEAEDHALFFTTFESLGPGNGAHWVAGRGDFAGHGSLWRRLADGRWQQVEVELAQRPSGMSSGSIFAPHDVAIAGATIWVATAHAGDTALGSEDIAYVLTHARVPEPTP